MPSTKSPVFRKAIFPWYRSKTAYGITVAFMLSVFLFGLAGISVARTNTQFNSYIWVPIVLVVVSGGITALSIIRLIKRRTAR
jgi:hypothetical protein